MADPDFLPDLNDVVSGDGEFESEEGGEGVLGAERADLNLIAGLREEVCAKLVKVEISSRARERTGRMRGFDRGRGFSFDESREAAAVSSSRRLRRGVRILQSA